MSRGGSAYAPLAVGVGFVSRALDCDGGGSGLPLLAVVLRSESSSRCSPNDCERARFVDVAEIDMISSMSVFVCACVFGGIDSLGSVGMSRVGEAEGVMARCSGLLCGVGWPAAGTV